MEKRLVSIFLMAIFLIGNVSAAIPPTKQSLTTYNYRINEVICSGNSLEVLVESLASVNLKLLFKATNKTTESIFSDKELKSFETSWFSIKTTRPCGELQKLEANGYSNQNIVYLNSESPYFFDGTESKTAETQPSAQTTTISSTSNIYFGSNLIETINSNNEIKHYHQDHLGSTRLITDTAGNLVSKSDYDPFGRDLSFSNSKYKFTGKEKDSSSLYYFGARYYDPSIGRFTQIDPSFNPLESPYSYVENNPLSKVDPNGEAPVNLQLIRLIGRIARTRASQAASMQEEIAFRNQWKLLDRMPSHFYDDVRYYLKEGQTFEQIAGARDLNKEALKRWFEAYPSPPEYPSGVKLPSTSPSRIKSLPKLPQEEPVIIEGLTAKALNDLLKTAEGSWTRLSEMLGINYNKLVGAARNAGFKIRGHKKQSTQPFSDVELLSRLEGEGGSVRRLSERLEKISGRKIPESTIQEWVRNARSRRSPENSGAAPRSE